MKTIQNIGNYIRLAVKYYAVIMVVAQAYDMISKEIKKVHAENEDKNVD